MSRTTVAETRSARMYWTYQDRLGEPIFQHCRYPTNDARGKGYFYRFPWVEGSRTPQGLWIPPWGWVNKKHPLADGLLFRLPRILADPKADLFWTEGERDSDALRERYPRLLVTAHHGGAGKATVRQAESIRKHRGRITLVADRDDAGAFDAVRRYDLLRAVGIPKKRLRVVWPVPDHKGGDARDHIEAGFGLDDFIPCKVDKLRKKAATVPPGPWCDNGSFPDDPNWPATWRANLDRNSRREP